MKGMELSLLGAIKLVYVTDSVFVYFKNSGPSVKNYKVINKLSHAFCASNELDRSCSNPCSDMHYLSHFHE